MAIAFSHAGSGSAKAGTTASATVTINANDTVIISISIHANTSPSQVIDSGGSVYHLVQAENNGAGDRVEMWATAVGAAKASASVTVNFAAATTYVVAVATYTGVLKFGNTGILTGSTAAVNTAQIYIVEKNNFLVMAAAAVGVATFSASAPNAVRASAATAGGSGSTNQGGAITDISFATTGFNNATATLSAAETWATVGLELQGSAPSYSYLCGFESGSTGEANAIVGSPSVQATTVHGGKSALQCNPTAASAYTQFKQMSGDPFSLAQIVFCSVRFYLNIGSLPNVNTGIYLASSSSVVWETLILNTDGSLTLKDQAATTATSSLKLSTGQWHQVSLEINPAYAGAAGQAGSVSFITVFVDGVQWATISSASVEAGDTALLGAGTDGTTPTCNLFFDDVLWSNGDQNVGPGKQVFLLPTADSSIGNWTAGAGGVTNLWQGVDNQPPVGKAAGSETNTTQIKNANATVPSDYTVTCQSYSVAGVPVGATVNAVVAVCSDGTEATTSATFGEVWIASNPAQSVPAPVNGFLYGLQAALGTFPSGWNTDEGPVSANPVVTLSTAPTVSVRKLTSSTIADDACFLGVYIDFLTVSASAAPVWNMPFLPGFGNGR